MQVIIDQLASLYYDALAYEEFDDNLTGFIKAHEYKNINDGIESYIRCTQAHKLVKERFGDTQTLGQILQLI